MRPPESSTASGLATDLSRAVRGEVRFDEGSRHVYSTDASNYRQVPIGVVVPEHAGDVVAAMEVCRSHDVPVLGRGGATSLAGQCCNTAVVFDFSKYMHGVLDVDPGARRAEVLPGTVLDRLRETAERHHLTFGPDPATHSQCTLGGMIGNNSCGVHSIMAGKTVDNIEELEVLTYDGARFRVGPTDEDELHRIIGDGGRRGEIYAGMRDIRDRYGDLIRKNFPDVPRRVSGYNLEQLLPENGFNLARALVGTESTCALVLQATARLVDSPQERSLVVVGFGDVYEAADRVPEVLESGPIGLEGIDEMLVRDMYRKRLHRRELDLLPKGNGWLLAEFGADTQDEAHAKAEEMMRSLGRSDGVTEMRRYDDPEEAAKVWDVRESGLGATARVPGDPDTWPGWEDSAVPPERLGEYLRKLRQLMRHHGYEGAFYGHFGDGCLHCRMSFDLVSPEGLRAWRSFLEQATDLVISFGGSLSGEHGDGQQRGELLSTMFGDEVVQAFREFKGVWDPRGRMNPGKVVDAHRLDENLRLGADYRPPATKTHFQFPDDDGDFARATQRCVGVGKCRRAAGGVMCPSYQVTMEEEHSTRGRARALFEMLSGRWPGEGWRSPDIKRALDLCLACKGCKGECPVNVDMATYKAEFLSHFYRRRLRPAAAYSMGLIMYGARLAARMPRLANLATSTPGLSRALKRVAGVAPERSIPQFADETFTSWFRRRDANASVPGTRSPVVLWPDTFNDHFHPDTARAATAVLEAAGFEVRIPNGWVCCGRPLYDYGFLGQAKRLLRRTLRLLEDEIREGIPVVVLEPSCAAVFRDELVNLFPRDRDARRLSTQTFVLAEFLDKKAPDFDLPNVEGRAVVQPHCHHSSILDFDAETRVLGRLGLDAEILDSGCCGMAGSFGFERGEHYEVSMRCAERVLLPAVRDLSDGTMVIADGFSCREQVAQAGGPKTLHLADVINAGIEHPPTRKE
ncbi:MAG: FAD-binding protein [Actinobacteria bacterium]|nr:FAD-binding protein [Actinomycetota bacterium]